jgi:DNA-binding NtrC family response regulator
LLDVGQSKESAMVRQILFADADRNFARRLVLVARRAGVMAQSATTAEEARRALVATSPTMFIANVRLGSLKGVELVHLARLANPSIRVVLYGSGVDRLLAREAQRAGAFFEPIILLPDALPRYIAAALPRSDRRDAARLDRRNPVRSGRRATDVVVSAAV